MNKKIILLSTLMAAGYGLSAQVKDVSFACGKQSCDVTFKFADSKDLPGFFQKYNAATGKWTVAFAKSDFAFGEGTFTIDEASNSLKNVRVFKESGKQGELLKFEWSTGDAVNSDKNQFTLKGSDFKISLPNAKAKSWKLSGVVSAQQKAAVKAAQEAERAEKIAKLTAEKEAKQQAAEEKRRQDSLDKVERILAAERAKAEKALSDSLSKAEKIAKQAAERDAKLSAAIDKKAALAAEKEAKLKAAEEKKAALAAAKAEKARKDSLAKAEKLAKIAAEKEAKLKAAEEKKAALAAAKVEKARKDSLAKAEKLAKIAAEKEAKLKAAEEKKAALAAAKAEKARKDSLAKAEKLAKIAAEKEAKLRAAEEKKAALAAAKAEKARQDSVVKAMKAISALIDGVTEMTSVVGFGLDQFELKMIEPITLDKVAYSDKKNTVTIAAVGPEKSPLLKVNAGSFVKSLAWTKDGLVLQLSANARPVLLNKNGSLILQNRESVATEGFLFWKALPNGIHTRRWVNPSEAQIPASIDEFAARYEKDSKNAVSASHSFFLTSMARELIVTADEIELYEGANENSTVLARLTFGEKLESLDLVGLFHKVQIGPKIGYVNKRAVSYRDELSAVQSERLKQIAAEKGNPEDNMDKQISFDSDDRVMYSSFGRRDPFVDVKGLVEEGINIDQMELVGIIWESDQPMAILSDVKNASVSYTIKEGDKVLNGKVLKITQTDVLFLIQEFGVSRRYSMGLPDKFGGKK